MNENIEKIKEKGQKKKKREREKGQKAMNCD